VKQYQIIPYLQVRRAQFALSQSVDVGRESSPIIMGSNAQNGLSLPALHNYRRWKSRQTLIGRRHSALSKLINLERGALILFSIFISRRLGPFRASFSPSCVRNTASHGRFTKEYVLESAEKEPQRLMEGCGHSEHRSSWRHRSTVVDS
jgi:hypothetical protein